MGNTANTPYDDAFRTMLVDCPRLIIPLINYVFDENYSIEEKIEVYHNEFFIGNEYQKERITDSNMGINNIRYHAECQSTSDGTIVLRMFEYDTQIAIDTAIQGENEVIFTFPYSVIIYLRDYNNIEDRMNIVVKAGGKCISYYIPVVKVPKLALDNIMERDLYFLIPFYLFKYEREFSKYENSKVRLMRLRDDYCKIYSYLRDKTESKKITEFEYQVIRNMINKVAESLADKYEKVKEGVESVMGGAVLEYEAKDILREGITQGITQGEIITLYELVKDRIITLEQAAERIGETPDGFLNKVNELSDNLL